jgi:hypothetical protein
MPWRKKDAIDQALRLWGKGYVAAAATLLWNERLNALQRDDRERVEEVDDIVCALRGSLEGDQRLAEFDALVGGQAAAKIDSAATQSPAAAASAAALTSDPVHAQRQRIAVSETCVVFATVVAIITWLHLKGGGSIVCSVDQVFRGANIEHGLTLAIAGGLLVSILIPLARTSAEGLVFFRLVGVLTFGAAIACVAADSATWQASQGCASLFGSTETHVTEHVYYLYILWGLPLLVLVGDAAVARACERMWDRARVTLS